MPRAVFPRRMNKSFICVTDKKECWRFTQQRKLPFYNSQAKRRLLHSKDALFGTILMDSLWLGASRIHTLLDLLRADSIFVYFQANRFWSRCQSRCEISWKSTSTSRWVATFFSFKFSEKIRSLLHVTFMRCSDFSSKGNAVSLQSVKVSLEWILN